MRRYSYHNVSGGKHGRMICNACGKLIEAGDYRVKDTPEAYVVWHRHCCEQDAVWLKIDNKKKAEVERAAVYSKACREFVEKWGKPDEGDFDV